MGNRPKSGSKTRIPVYRCGDHNVVATRNGKGFVAIEGKEGGVFRMDAKGFVVKVPKGFKPAKNGPVRVSTSARRSKVRKARKAKPKRRSKRRSKVKTQRQRRRRAAERVREKVSRSEALIRSRGAKKAAATRRNLRLRQEAAKRANNEPLPSI